MIFAKASSSANILRSTPTQNDLAVENPSEVHTYISSTRTQENNGSPTHYQSDKIWWPFLQAHRLCSCQRICCTQTNLITMELVAIDNDSRYPLTSPELALTQRINTKQPILLVDFPCGKELQRTV